MAAGVGQGDDGSVRRRGWRVAALLFLLASVALAVAFFVLDPGDVVAVDRCLDAGGAWDHAQSRCRYR